MQQSISANPEHRQESTLELTILARTSTDAALPTDETRMVKECSRRATAYPMDAARLPEADLFRDPPVVEFMGDGIKTS
jgi:hypothetical protein